MMRDEFPSIEKLISELDEDLEKNTNPNLKQVLSGLKELLHASNNGIDFKKVEVALVYLSLIPISGGLFSKTLGDLYGKVSGGEEIKNQIKKEGSTYGIKLPLPKQVEETQILKYYFEELRNYHREYRQENQWYHQYEKTNGEVVNKATRHWQDNLQTKTSAEIEADTLGARKDLIPLPNSAREFYMGMTIEEQGLKSYEEKLKNREIIVKEFDELLNKMLDKTKYSEEEKIAIKTWFADFGGQEMENILAELFLHHHFSADESQQVEYQVGSVANHTSNWSGSERGIEFEFMTHVLTLQKGMEEVVYMSKGNKLEIFKSDNAEKISALNAELAEIKKKGEALPLMNVRVKIGIDIKKTENGLVVQPKVIDCTVIGYTNFITSPRARMEEEQREQKRNEGKSPTYKHDH